jgi:hypothetical protein
LPFVYTIRNQFIIKNKRLMPPKKKNTGKGLPLFASIAIGVNMTQRVQPIQFIIVAKGTILAGMISGTYIHTEGPIEMP